MIQRMHHVAYRCRDALRTADFYTKALGLEFTMAMSEDRVPTTGEPCPYMHIFFKLGDGSHIAFFELPEAAPMNLDPNTPPWVQHIALEMDGPDDLDVAVVRLKEYGTPVIGPVDHHIFQSVYFHDPDGHRLELTYRTEIGDAVERLAATAQPMLEEWGASRKVSTQASWVHASLKHAD